jgi:hypothetical protein
MASTRIQMPISGRFRMSSMMFPTQKLITSPQKRSGFSVTSRGPGTSPWISKAPMISAMMTLPGMPRVMVGMNAVWSAALFAASGPRTPSIAPLPNRDGSFATRFSMA